jgi:hypothetical protein
MITTLTLGMATLTTWKAPAFEDLSGGIITVMRKYGDKLYVGGTFERANRKLANNVAVWDGTSWSTLGKGVDGGVKDICQVGTDIYVCGDFSYVNKGKNDEGTPAYNIAKFDGTKWSALAPRTVDQKIYALATDGKRLFIGGNFKKINDETETNAVALWDGKKFQAIGGGFDRYVWTMAWHKGKLYAGGYFAENGDDACVNMAVWDGAKSWSEVAGAPRSVKRLSTDGENLYVAGEFDAIKKLDGTKLTDHLKISGGAEWVHSEGGKLYIAGESLDGVNGKGTHNLAIWDGKSVTTAEEFIYSHHRCLVPYKDNLIVGGNYKDTQGTGWMGTVIWRGGKNFASLQQ